jgi:hypothetical protein
MTRTSPGVLSSIYRTFSFENRRTTLTFISGTINRTFELLEYLEKSNNVLYDSIVTDLIESQKGLVNLQQTYSDDVKFQCDIDTLLQIIQSKIKEFGDDDIESPNPIPHTITTSDAITATPTLSCSPTRILSKSFSFLKTTLPLPVVSDTKLVED